MASDTINNIMRSAEDKARSGGYNAFSFREIAKDIGIKSASIHYHFPTKADLATSMAERYTEKFNVFLVNIQEREGTLHDKLSAYANLFYHALHTEQRMCLCGLFAAEMNVLPDDVKKATRLFFEAHVRWIQTLLEQHAIPSAHTEALKILASMEGGMIVAKALESEEYFLQSIDLSPYK